MTKQLLWDAGPGECRAGLVEDGALVEFRIIRNRAPEQALIAAGESYTARLVERMGSGQALVDLGGGKQAMLQPCPALPIGSLIEVEMIRAPIPEPGQWKLPKVREQVDTPLRSREPGWHMRGEPWELFLAHWAPSIDEIVCVDSMMALDVERALGESVVVRIDPAAIEAADFDSLIEAATIGSFPIVGGALHIERTRAMVMIDIDGTLDALSLNLAAAAEIPCLLRLLDISGPVGIDFVAVSNRADRLAVGEALDQAAAGLDGCDRTAINGFGFCQLIRPRVRASIPEILCGTRVGTLSTESLAVALLRAAGRSVGHGPRELVGPPRVIDLIKAWPHEIAALRSSLGVAIELVSDSAATGYGHVHVSLT
jgi:ribonuclease G